MDFKCDCGWKIINADGDYVVTCRCGKPMKPLISKKANGSKVPCSDGLSNPAYVKEELEKILKYLEDDHVTKNQHRLGCLGSSEIASAVEKIKSLIKKG